MLIAIHTITGALIGESINNPALAGLAGFASHFVLDMIPHGDEQLLACPDRCHPNIKKYLTIIKTDALASLAIFLFIAHQASTNSLAMLSGMLGSVLPDILAGIHELGYWKKWQRLYFKNFWRFHRYTHNQLIRWQPSFRLGLLIQGGFLYLLLRLVR